MKNCENCRFSFPIEYNKEFLEKRMTEIQSELDYSQKKKVSWLVYSSVTEEIHRWNLIDEKRDIQIKLIEMEEDVICRRYPTPKQSYKNYWCGEYLEKL